MAAPQIKAGDVLDRKYRVERVLGTGGMGMVVLCRHVQLGQRVALKFMLKEALADPSNAERFAREARSAVRLQSPHTARVLDVGKLKNGEPYMVMEYLDGKDLDEVVRTSGPLPPHVAVDFILQACEAFAEAHGLGMIHRDIKPKNLFLAQTVDGRPLVKVLDFGLAKTIGAMGDISLTATSAVFGSPQYMSPEQMRSAKDVDTRSDIWSIGVCLYELLTTRVPFDAANLAEICAMVLKDPVEPPSKWAIDLPPDLDAVVVKCLAKDPKDRYQTVAELAFALEPWAAVEGSARRILHVMQTVQKTDVPTMMNVDPSGADHAGPKTMDAWDSGERTRLGAKGLPRGAWAAFAGFLVLGLVGLAAIISWRIHRAPPTTAAGSVASSALVADPPPAVTPVPMPAAVPDTTAAAAVATVTATTAPVAPAPVTEPAATANVDVPPSDPGNGAGAPPPASTVAAATAATSTPKPPVGKPPVGRPPLAHPATPGTRPTATTIAKPKVSADPGGHM
jgi:tRNA A-37 threonylcarbamoyl transferase component Bud32